ncbi:MAG: Thioredoxin-disulfide reductase [Parcubacteria group bacterium GW2011_GWE2_38_18]|nr:MAG: Thioredoxin-disulfide reductase [Parcubacteria group bacterium GW2011_GWE2_38_18]
MIYDTIIIGAGPAGVAAGIYTSRREMKTLIISRDVGGQLTIAGEIENYPGFDSIGNIDLIKRFEDNIKAAGIELVLSEVKQVAKADGLFQVYTEKDMYTAKTIIIAMGLIPKRLAIPGEEKFMGKGVSYCANCDGPFFKGKIVTVIGGGNSALDAAEVLSKIAAKVYLVHRNQDFRGFEALVEQIKDRPNIEILLNSEVKEIIGENRVEKIMVNNRATNETRELEVNGLFIEIGRIASTDIFSELVKRDEWAQIVVDEKCNTSEPGIFGAGDVTQVEFKQITIATGQGTIAALTAYQYLQQQEGKNVKVFDRSIKKN